MTFLACAWYLCFFFSQATTTLFSSPFCGCASPPRRPGSSPPCYLRAPSCLVSLFLLVQIYGKRDDHAAGAARQEEPGDELVSIDDEDAATYRRKINKWVHESLIDLDDTSFDAVTIISQAAMNPVMHCMYFLQKHSSRPSPLAELVCSKASSIQAEFWHLLSDEDNSHWKARQRRCRCLVVAILAVVSYICVCVVGLCICVS